MVIKIGPYRLKQEKCAPMVFNMTEWRRSETGDGEGRLYDVKLAFGISIPHAIELIASYELLSRDEEVELRQYVQQYGAIAETLRRSMEQS